MKRDILICKQCSCSHIDCDALWEIIFGCLGRKSWEEKALYWYVACEVLPTFFDMVLPIKSLEVVGRHCSRQASVTGNVSICRPQIIAETRLIIACHSNGCIITMRTNFAVGSNFMLLTVHLGHNFAVQMNGIGSLIYCDDRD